MKVKCAYCGLEIEKETGHVNRALKLNMGLFCNKTCFGLSKRVNRTDEERRKIKADYDREYRKNNPDIKEKKRAYYKTPNGRALQKRNREKRKEAHAEYIKTDKYRAWKREYDEKYHAKTKYGEYYESAIILKQLEETILPEKQEAKIQKGTYNKSQKRKRLWNSLQQTLNKHYGTPYNQ
jgi:hypothetical protein